ncbi:Ribosomal protein S6 modification protein [Gimesia panareensis]|uniref:Ribosomal protein S6 modification protein n=1 Tax=Gimesia panareensis TaxID=2527978 RepID=A0A518FNM6_9PLAN|nr:RimK family alpha-L-glutamate ligase [Gimesia panareensis]QDV17961.1 Ribosomal protein S6 modification protein [Gimesia panareensis]
MRIAILGNQGSWYCRELKAAAEARGHQACTLEFRDLDALLSGQSMEQFCCYDADEQQINLNQFDCLIIRTMPPGSLEQVIFRMDLLGRLEQAGVTVFNTPRAIECAVDKYLTTSRLAAAGLPVPATAVCESSAAAMQRFEELGGDVVVKPLFGSEGRGIFRISDPDLAYRSFRTLERTQSVIYLQQYVAHPGYDLRILILNGTVTGAIRRHNQTDFRTNISRQGRAEAYTPTDAEVQLALRASDLTQAEFAGVDLLPPVDAPETRYLLEVNAVPGWRGLQSATNVNVAALVIEYLEQKRNNAGASNAP